MRKILFGWILAILLRCPVAAQSSAHSSPIHDLHCDAGDTLIIETAALEGITPSRALALWMCNAEKHEEEIYDDVYTCPDQSRGHFYRGRTWLSLIDGRTGRAINTIPIRSDWENEDTFDIPYRIARYYYEVNDPTDKQGEGKPRILSLDVLQTRRGDLVG